MILLIVFVIILVVLYVKRDKESYSVPITFLLLIGFGISFLIFFCGLLFIYTEEGPQQKSTTLKLVEIQPTNTYQQFFELKEDSSVYFCVETENNTQQIKTVDIKDSQIFIEQIERGETPKVVIREVQSCGKLIRKPNIWFDLFGYIFLSKKDIGDVVYQDSFSGEATKETTYTFYIPKADKETASN